MAMIRGSVSLPTAQLTSQLVNDTRFSSIREYLLDMTTLSGSIGIAITDLIPNSVIYRIEVIILKRLASAAYSSDNITVKVSDNSILMDSTWNDPNKVGTYSSSCYYTTLGIPNEVMIYHSLGTILRGAAILRLHIYNNVNEYTDLLTSNGANYLTKDQNGISVIQ